MSRMTNWDAGEGTLLINVRAASEEIKKHCAALDAAAKAAAATAEETKDGMQVDNVRVNGDGEASSNGERAGVLLLDLLDEGKDDAAVCNDLEEFDKNLYDLYLATKEKGGAWITWAAASQADSIEVYQGEKKKNFVFLKLTMLFYADAAVQLLTQVNKAKMISKVDGSKGLSIKFLIAESSTVAQLAVQVDVCRASLVSDQAASKPTAPEATPTPPPSAPVGRTTHTSLTAAAARIVAPSAKRVGRPPSAATLAMRAAAAKAAAAGITVVEPVAPRIPKKKGRPRKHPLPEEGVPPRTVSPLIDVDGDEDNNDIDVEEPPPERKRVALTKEQSAGQPVLWKRGATAPPAPVSAPDAEPTTSRRALKRANSLSTSATITEEPVSKRRSLPSKASSSSDAAAADRTVFPSSLCVVCHKVRFFYK